MKRSLDLICLGRAAVDFYGEQIGGRLEDMQSFAKYLGGSSANLAAGTARLGLRSSMLTRVGNEQIAALPSPEAKRPFQRQRACVNRPLFVWFRPAFLALRLHLYFCSHHPRNSLSIALLTGRMEVS